MASLGTTFDPNTVKPSTGGGSLHPAGDFELEPIESEVKVNNGGNGKVAKWVFANTGRDDPGLKGTKVYANMNIEHEKAQVQTIGQEELSALCAATGFTEQLTDTEQLHFRPFYARIVHEQQIDFKTKEKLFYDDGSPKMQAVIKRYLFEDGDVVPQPPAGKSQPQQQPQQQQQRQAAPQQQAAGGGRQWQRRA